MKAVIFDPQSGIAGDMTAAALVNLGIDQQSFLQALGSIAPDQLNIELSQVIRHGIAALHFKVLHHDGGSLEEPALSAHDHDYHHEHDHDHDHHHEHDHHDHHHEHEHEHHHEHRSLPDVLAIIMASGLPPDAQDTACRIYSALAAAEAQVHGCAVSEVHFHEVGALDAIVDVCAVALALHLLGVEKIYCSPVSVGGGSIRAAHGILPVPAPATTILLKGFSCRMGPVQRELCTPTGAAILAALAEPLPHDLGFCPLVQGFGAGTLDFENHANVLRATLVDLQPRAQGTDEVSVLSCTVDDMDGRLLTHLFPLLLQQGALDVCASSVTMKKNRLGLRLEVLAPTHLEQSLAQLVLRESSSIGIRIHRERRLLLDRRVLLQETSLGPIRFKAVYLHGQLLRAIPEYEDCAAAAQTLGLSVQEALHRAQANFIPPDHT